MEKATKIKALIEEFNLEIVIGEEWINKEIVVSDLHRPGIELTGHTIENKYDIEGKIQIFGKEEKKYIESLKKNIKHKNLTNYISYEFPCIIVTENEKIDKMVLEISNYYHTPVFRTKEKLEFFMEKLHTFLEKKLAAEITVRGFTLMEVFGMGILIKGDAKSKIGATIELLEKGHIYITDDVLTIKHISETTLIGMDEYKKEHQKEHYYLNLNSSKKINVIEFYGIGSVRSQKGIDLIINFENWKKGKFYDRLGVDTKTQFLLGVEIPKLSIPVRKGRNLSIIIEAAARNQRLKQSGKNSAIYFLEQTKDLIAKNNVKEGESNMKKIKSLSLNKLVDKFDFQILAGEDELDSHEIREKKVHRPSLEFTGFYDILEESGEHKIHLIGETELKYLDKLPVDVRREHLQNYLNYEIPVIILTNIKTVPEYFLEMVKKTKKVLLSKEIKGSKLMINLNEYLNRYFAPFITLHGVFVEVFGFGVLLMGKSGIGKSETALELIHRGHRLIADDMIKLKKYSDGRVVGRAEKIPYFMEIRGLGIIDIKTLYGLGAVRSSKQLDLILNLEEFEPGDDETNDYEEDNYQILKKDFPRITLHISSGRNAASMVEIATMNLRAKIGGYDSTKSYIKNHENMEKIIKEGKKKPEQKTFKNLEQIVMEKGDYETQN
ncbi:MAG: HPr(Ser) kinase/phosphatase [Fusobacteriota bacterium]